MINDWRSWTPEMVEEHNKKVRGEAKTPFASVVNDEGKGNAPSKKGKPNKTELAYFYHLQMEFPGCTPIFQGLTIQLESGHAYRPDWVVKIDGRILCVEVKNGAYKHASYGRSRLAYDCARTEWPMLQFRWVEKTKEGWKERH